MKTEYLVPNVWELDTVSTISTPLLQHTRLEVCGLVVPVVIGRTTGILPTFGLRSRGKTGSVRTDMVPNIDLYVRFGIWTVKSFQVSLYRT